MEILLEGDKRKAEEARRKPQLFMCYMCGCRWKADKGEYIRNFDQREGRYILQCVCPCCGEIGQTIDYC